MDSCLIDNYLENENKLLDLLNSGYDAEHVHKMCFKENTKEISILHCGHLLGPNGMLIDD
jgi:hypothetical protein